MQVFNSPITIIYLRVTRFLFFQRNHGKAVFKNPCLFSALTVIRAGAMLALIVLIADMARQKFRIRRYPD